MSNERHVSLQPEQLRNNRTAVTTVILSVISKSGFEKQNKKTIAFDVAMVVCNTYEGNTSIRLAFLFSFTLPK